MKWLKEVHLIGSLVFVYSPLGSFFQVRDFVIYHHLVRGSMSTETLSTIDIAGFCHIYIFSHIHFVQFFDDIAGSIAVFEDDIL